MSETRLDPYLFFRGDCRAAMEFYQKAFGGELTMQTMAEAPDGTPGKEEHRDHVMHAHLSGGITTLFASDCPDASPAAAKVELCLGGTDEKELRAAFEALAEGGKVRSPLERQFWGATFGMLTDRFGIDWMVNITSA